MGFWNFVGVTLYDLATKGDPLVVCLLPAFRYSQNAQSQRAPIPDAQPLLGLAGVAGIRGSRATSLCRIPSQTKTAFNPSHPGDGT